MRNESDIPVQKVEDLVAANIRRDNYAQKRDLQASEFNAAIAKRLLEEAPDQIRCEICGKEFAAEKGTGDLIKCPDCR